MPWLPRPGVQTSTVSAHGGMGRLLGSLSQGKTSSIWGPGRGLFLLEPLQLSTSKGKDTNKFQCWGQGRAGSPNPGGTPRYTRQEQGSLQRAAGRGWFGKERYSNTEATVNTTPWGRAGAGRKSKQSQVVCPGLPGSPGSCVSLWRAPGGVGGGAGQGACGWGLGRRLWTGVYTYHSFLEMKDPSF